MIEDKCYETDVRRTRKFGGKVFLLKFQCTGPFSATKAMKWAWTNGYFYRTTKTTVRGHSITNIWIRKAQ